MITSAFMPSLLPACATSFKSFSCRLASQSRCLNGSTCDLQQGRSGLEGSWVADSLSCSMMYNTLCTAIVSDRKLLLCCMLCMSTRSHFCLCVNACTCIPVEELPLLTLNLQVPLQPAGSSDTSAGIGPTNLHSQRHLRLTSNSLRYKLLKVWLVLSTSRHLSLSTCS